MPYDEDGNYYPTYGGASSPGGSSWDTGAYDPNASFDPYGPKVDVPTGPADAIDRREQQLAAAQAALNARGANGGAAARNPSSSMSTSQSAYSAATGGAYDPSTAMTAYQQAQLGLSQQQLYQDQQQFMATLNNQANIAAGNLGFNYAQLGQQGGQFQQNYGLDLAQFAMQSQGTPYQWAQLGLNANQIDTQQYLDQQRIDLSRQLGMGDDARGWAQMALAEEDHDLRMYLGQNDVLKSQAQIQAEMARLGIDLYQANLSAEIQRAKLALDQQVASGQAAALSQQAAADAARAQAALRAVEVELQLGEGNLELGWQKTRDAMALGLEQNMIAREELGLKDKIATQDLALQTLLGIEGINVSREKLANDRMLGISDQQTRRDIAQLNAQVEQQRIASTLTGPRDWAKAVEMRRMMGAGGQNPFAALAPGAGQLAGEVGGPSEPLTLDSFLADNGFQNFQGFNFNNTPWQQMTAGGFQSPAGNPWSGMNIPQQGGALDWNTIYQQITGQSGGTTAAGQVPPAAPYGNDNVGQGVPAPGGQPGGPPPPQQPGPYGADGRLDFAALGLQVYGDPNRPAQFAEDQLGENMARWQSMVARGHMTQEQMDQAITTEKARIQAEIAKIPEMAAAGMFIANDPAGGFPVQGATDVMAPDGRRLRMYEREGQRYLVPIKQSGGSYMDAAGVIHQDFRDVDALGNPVGTEWMLPTQKNYRAADGSTYAVPHWAGPQNPNDQLISDTPQYQVQNMQGQWVQEGSAAARGEPVIQADGSVTMPDGSVRPSQTPAPAAAPASGQQSQAMSFGGFGGSFQAPTLSGLPGMPAMTGNFMGIPIPAVPQIGAAPYQSGGPSIVAQMYQAYLQSFPTPQAQQSPQGQNAMQYVMAMMQQAQQQQPAVTTPPPPTGTTPPPTGAPPTGQQPYTPYTPYGGGIQPGNTTGNPNWMPGYEPNSMYYSGGYGMPAVSSWQPDSPGVYRTGANADVAGAHIRPGEAGGAPATQYIQTKVRSSVDAAKAALAGAPTSANATTGIQRNTGPGTGHTQAQLDYLRGEPTIPQWTNPNYAQPTQSAAQPLSWENSPAVTGQHADFGSPTANPGYGTWPQGTGWPEYATGTNYVPQTGPAIVHQGEAIVPAAQNPNNPAAPIDYGFGDEYNQHMARLFAQQEQDAAFSAPTSNQQPQVQQAPPPAAPANLNSLTNPQQPLTPQQQQQAPNQQAQNPMAPQPVPREPQHAQPTSPPNATIYTAGFPAQATWTPTANPNLVNVPGYGQLSLAQARTMAGLPAVAPQPTPGSPGAGFTPTPPFTWGGFTAPTSTPPPATTNPAMTALMARLPSPQQVSYRTWATDLSPSERELAIGEWTRQGYYVPDILDLIERNRLSKAQGAYSGGYAGIGR
jgi:hypothetical protein